MKYQIPQFDILSLGVQIFNLSLLFCSFYYLTIQVFIPLYTEIKKFRVKKYKKSFNIMCLQFIIFFTKQLYITNKTKIFF